MKKLVLICLLIPAMSMGQKKNVVNASRYFPKVDKVLEFEKALSAHAQKYHTGDWKWRVFDIQNRPDSSGYHIKESYGSWETMYCPGKLGTEHNTDRKKTTSN